MWALGWISIAISQHWQMVMLGRLLSGFCVGLSLPAAQIYVSFAQQRNELTAYHLSTVLQVSECCSPKIRGVLGSLPSIFMSFGILVSYVLGSLVAWDTLAWFNSAIAVLLCVLMNLIPDSPVWLRSKNQLQAAEKATNWLKLKPATTAMPSSVKPSESMDLEHGDSKPVKADKSDRPHSLSVLLSRPCLMPLLIGMTLLVLQQISGIDAIIFFTVEIFRASGEFQTDLPNAANDRLSLQVAQLTAMWRPLSSAWFNC